MLNRHRIAGKIANAASFFDCVKNGLQEAHKTEAEVYITSLHSCASLLAGERNAEIYKPEETQFEVEKHYTNTILCKHRNTELDLVQWRSRGEEHAYGCIAIASGPFRLQLSITPTEARQLAMALMDTADDMEASAAQFQREQIPELEAA